MGVVVSLPSSKNDLTLAIGKQERKNTKVDRVETPLSRIRDIYMISENEKDKFVIDVSSIDSYIVCPA